MTERKPQAIRSMKPGERHGIITVGERTGKQGRVHATCDCGTKFTPRYRDLVSGNTTSCGCTARLKMAAGPRTHGMWAHPMYNSWRCMRYQRSNGYTDLHPTYADVRRDPKWDTFTGFHEDMADGWFPGACLSRIGDVGDYTKDNCRWLTRAENTREQLQIRHHGRSASDGSLSSARV